MVWAWMLWCPYALGTRTELRFGHTCSGRRMFLENERNDGSGMHALAMECSWKQERNYCSGTDALVIACSWNSNGIMVRAWMLWSPCVQREECSGYSQASTSEKEDSSPETLYGSVARRGFDSRSGRSFKKVRPR